MLKFDFSRFLPEYIAQFGKPSSRQSDGLAFLLEQFAADVRMADLRHAAYMLATVHHETAKTYQPIDEHGTTSYFERRYGYQTAVGQRLGNVRIGDGAKFHGRGFVQLTGRRNYKVMDERLSVGLESSPDLAKEPAIAYSVMSTGMFNGMFTGQSLGKWIGGHLCDYVHARKIINGMDCAELIAGYAHKFEKCLSVALISDTPAVSTNAEPTQDTEQTNSVTPDSGTTPLGHIATATAVTAGAGATVAAVKAAEKAHEGPSHAAWAVGASLFALSLVALGAVLLIRYFVRRG